MGTHCVAWRLLAAMALSVPACFAVPASATEQLLLDSGTVVRSDIAGTEVALSGSAMLVLTSADPVPDGASVSMAGAGTALVLESVIPGEAIELLSRVSVDGRSFDRSRDRLSVYGNGCVLIPDGWSDPLTIYDEPSCSGNSMVCECDVYYRSEMQGEESYLPEESIGAFDNRIRSFRLKKGFSCVLANNPDGTGYSRVFVANDGDLIVDKIPTGLEFASFIRVSRFDWIGKRGICGGDVVAVTRSSWFYDWGAGANGSDDYEYVPMRHNRWWDSWENIGSRTSVSNLLGYNEPDHADQSDLGPDIAISEWPNYMKSGLRIGSPAPDAINKDWLVKFLATADSLNYRVDFVATHMYWDSQDPDRLCATIRDLCVNRYKGRPMWITEWNNGANWTGEHWPDQKGPQRDADFNIIYDSEGHTVEVARPHTEANSAVQAEWLGRALKSFDDCVWLERHSLYNWVEDARSVEIGGKLTPAGQVFAGFNSRPGFSRESEYVHRWRIAPPWISSIRKSGQRVRIDFYDHNGETAVNYIVQRRIDGGKWEQIAVIEPGVDYKMGKSTYFRDFDLVGGRQEYRFKATAYIGGESKWSRVVGIDVPVSGIERINDNGSGFSVYTTGGCLIIESDTDGSCVIYRIDGTVARRVTYTRGQTVVDGLSRGIYIVDGIKAVI